MLWEENALLKREQLMRDVSQKPFENWPFLLRTGEKGDFSANKR